MKIWNQLLLSLFLGVIVLQMGCGKSVTEGQELPYAFEASPELQAHLTKVIEAWRFKYDPEEKLFVLQPKGTVATGFDLGQVHSIRWTLEYATPLMDSGREDYFQRALDILDVVLSTQEIDPNHELYSNFPRYLETSVREENRVDTNQKDFICLQLINMRKSYADRIPAEMLVRMDAAIQHSVRGIVKRKVPPSYTNVAMMSAYVALVAGEMYDMEEIKAYGLENLRGVYDYCMEQGSFNEYNSPNYNIVALNALLRMKQYIRNPEARKMVEELYYFAWEHVAVRFHPPTGQWAGPHSRSYQDLLKPGQKALLRTAIEGRLVLTEDVSDAAAGMEYRLQHRLPDDLKHYFTQLDEPREVVQTFEKPAYAWMPEVIGTTWLTEELALGTVNRCQMWEQRRNLQAYWGTSEKPSYLRLRFLKDSHDFSAVQFFSVQDKQQVLAGLSFSTDGGDRHLFFDHLEGGKFKANDLRLRFEFGGGAKTAKITTPEALDGQVVVEANGLEFIVQAPIAIFDGVEGRWESGHDEKTAWVDLVLYHGADRAFFLPDTSTSAIGFALGINTPDGGKEYADMADLSAEVLDENLSMQWNGLSMEIPVQPGPNIELQAKFKGSVNGKNRERLESK